MPVIITNRDNYGKTSRKFSCGHNQGPDNPFPPKHRYDQHMQRGNEIKFNFKCMKCDETDVWKELRVIREDTSADLERLTKIRNQQEREEMDRKSSLNTQLALRRVLFGFEDRWNEAPQPDSPEPGPARASLTTPEGFQLSTDNKYLDTDNVTTLEELMHFMDSLLPGQR